MTPKEFFDSIDYQQLVFQKDVLIKYRGEIEDDITGSVEGIINMIDALQDCAAELYGEEKVFMINKIAEYTLKYRHYCNDNRLEDDSRYISTGELFDFVEGIIIPGEDEEG